MHYLPQFTLKSEEYFFKVWSILSNAPFPNSSDGYHFNCVMLYIRLNNDIVNFLSSKVKKSKKTKSQIKNKFFRKAGILVLNIAF